MIMSLDMKDCGVKNVRPWHKADVKTYSIGKLLDAASAAWRRQLKLNGVPRVNGAVTRRSRLLF